MQVSDLSPASQEFLEEINSQLDPTAQMLFGSILINLGKPSPEQQKKLDFLQALLDAGVDNWDGYDEVLEEMEDSEEDFEDEEES